jgi:hypothetical protein
MVSGATPQAPHGLEWEDVIAGYDFNLLPPTEIQAWIRQSGFSGPLCCQLSQLSMEGLLHFEETLWAACVEATGALPRPGTQKWASAQDRWRKRLLREALNADPSPQALAQAVEEIYERVGCPEDMLGLWHRSNPWQNAPTVAFRQEIEAFLHADQA